MSTVTIGREQLTIFPYVILQLRSLRVVDTPQVLGTVSFASN